MPTSAPASITETLNNLALADPLSPAVTLGDETLTRGELRETSDRVAGALRAEGVTHNSFVTIALPNSLAFVITAIACWRIGAVPQPVSWRLPSPELQAIVKLAEPSLIVAADRRVLASDAGTERNPPVRSYEELSGGGELGLEPAPVAYAWKAPTSGGSTGKPKLIVSAESAVVPDEPSWRIQRDGCILIPGPLYHNAPFAFAFHGLFYGNHLVLMQKFDAEQFLSHVEKHAPDLTLLVPTMMVRTLRLAPEVRERYDVTSLRTVWHLGAPCPTWAKTEWIDWLGEDSIWELYGGTEAQAVAIIDGHEWRTHVGSVGKVAIGEMQVLDPVTLERLPTGSVGEIFMRTGPEGHASYAYVGSEPYRIDGGWESLGDMGFFDEDGYLYIADRRQDMILVGGANVYPAEIESALDRHPAVSSCAVIGLPHDDLGQVPHALLYASADVERPSDEELSRFLSSELGRLKVPRTFEWVDQPLRDDAGKVRRSELQAARLGR